MTFGGVDVVRMAGLNGFALRYKNNSNLKNTPLSGIISMVQIHMSRSEHPAPGAGFLRKDKM